MCHGNYGQPICPQENAQGSLDEEIDNLLDELTEDKGTLENDAYLPSFDLDLCE